MAIATSSVASFVGADSATRGNWRGAYGADGFDLAADTSGANPKLPAYAKLSVVGASTYTWGTNTGNPDALKNAAGSGDVAACWYSPTSFDIRLNLTDGRAHRVALYALDWDSVVGDGNPPRSERIDVLDATTGAVLATHTISSFKGEYVAFNIQGSVTIRVTNLSPPGASSSNAVVSGIFFGGAAATGNAATFLAADTATRGNWRGTYGVDGFDIPADTSGANPKLPAYAKLSVVGGTASAWSTSTTDPRAPQNAANTGRIASGWFGSTIKFNVNLTDGRAHRVALYALDWDGYGGGRSERVDVLDAATNAVLDTRTISSFGQGVYLSWTIKGKVTIRVTNLNSHSNATVGALLFG